MSNRGKHWINSGATPDRILEWLELDGGWLTALSIATDLKIERRTVERAMVRLKERGLIKARKLDPDRHNSAFLYHLTDRTRG